MTTWIENIVLIVGLAIAGISGFVLILIAKPFFWLAVIAYILAQAFL